MAVTLAEIILGDVFVQNKKLDTKKVFLIHVLAEVGSPKSIEIIKILLEDKNDMSQMWNELLDLTDCNAERERANNLLL